MSVDRKAWGWCPSVVRPMPLDDGLMVRIRVPGGAMTPTQAAGLAELAARYGAGVIELTNRANLQVRGLSAAEHEALVPALDALGLTAIDRTKSGRVNITQSPFRDVRAEGVAEDLAKSLAAAEFRALPEKFGFVIDLGAERVLADVPGDVRIEAAGDAIILRADGAETGRRVQDPVAGALNLARWFIASGGVGPDGRGRMVEHLQAMPADQRGVIHPNPPVTVTPKGPGWVIAEAGKLAPDTLARVAEDGAGDIRVTPFRALYLPDLAEAGREWNKAEPAIGASGGSG